MNENKISERKSSKRPDLVNPARTILEKEVFHLFADANMIESLRFENSHYTNALIAPLKDATGLWVVFSWAASEWNNQEVRPFNFSVDGGRLEIISPEKCARAPLNLVDPDRVVHLIATANVCPGECDHCPGNGVMHGPMEPVIKCRMPNYIESGSDNAYVVLTVMDYIMRRGREERYYARERAREKAWMVSHQMVMA